ncbi:MAG TPA: hypothetical protein VJA94_05500 [Candidatus Angelobacter sp.]
MDLETQAPPESGSPGRSQPPVIKLLALMLMVGGVVGIALSLAFIVNQRITVLIIGFGIASVLIFGWSALKGLDLWKGKPAGYKWAKILFAAQIPLINFSGFCYWFYTGLNVWFMVQWGNEPNPGFTQVGVYFNFGSALYFYVGYWAKVSAFAINPIAIAALIYLLANSPPYEQRLTEQAINPT